jgi:hypothetical protein
MKRLAVILPLILLVGCATPVPVTPKWPAVPAELLAACPDLKTIDPKNEKISAFVEIVADNYKEYYQCSDKVSSWILWYNEQQKLWKTIK